MSREIKFRVWDGKEMREPPPLNEWDSHDGYMWSEYDTKGQIMQFTGLKDRNGKEIYEGDLPGDQYESGCVQWCDTCHGWSIGIAAIEGHCHQCDGDFMWLDFVDDVRQGKVEIVGNRFENPELIPA